MNGLRKLVGGISVGLAMGCSSTPDLVDDLVTEWTPKPEVPTNPTPDLVEGTPVLTESPVKPPEKPAPLRVDWAKVHAERSVGYYDPVGTWHVRGVFPYPGLVVVEMNGPKVVQFLKNSKGVPYDGKSGITDTNADWKVFAPVNVEDKSEDLGIVFYGKASRNGATFAVFDPSGVLLTSKVIRNKDRAN